MQNEFIEKKKTIGKYDCYGTNNLELVRCLIRDGYTPIDCEVTEQGPVHYFKRSKNFDYDKLFHKGMIEGWLPWFMLEMFDKYDEGPGSFDFIYE